MLVRREEARDVEAVAAMIAEAFPPPPPPPPAEGGGAPIEVGLLAELRVCDAWIPRLSLVAEDGSPGGVAGHVVCTRGTVEGRPALGLGPLAVHPRRQGQGVGSALMHAVLAAADALDEPLVALLGEPEYYRRFGFRRAEELGITPPVAKWGRYFQVRLLAAYPPDLRGRFRYAEPFERL